MNEQAEQLGELQDNFKETSETKEKLQEALTAAETDLQEKQGLIVEKDAQITTFNIKVREFVLLLIIFALSFYLQKFENRNRQTKFNIYRDRTLQGMQRWILLLDMYLLLILCSFIQGCRSGNEVER